MARYSNIPIITTTEDPKRRYINTKYPEIKPEFSDTYVYTTIGDRYDLLALKYYKDTSLWWVISRANPLQPSDSLSPNPGEQIRIPAASRLASILGAYDNLNRTA